MLTAASGLGNAYTRLDTPSQLFTTGYGQVLLIKTASIVVLGVIGWIMRDRIIATLGTASRARVFARIAGLELAVMASPSASASRWRSSPIPAGRGRTALLRRVPARLPVSRRRRRSPRSLGGFHLEPLFLTAS